MLEFMIYGALAGVIITFGFYSMLFIMGAANAILVAINRGFHGRRSRRNKSGKRK